MTVALGLAAALLWATSDLFSVQITRAADPTTGLAWTLAGGMLVGLPLWLALAPSPAVPRLDALAPALVAAPAYLLGNAAFFAAIRRGSLSIVAPLVGLEGGIATLIAVALLGSRLDVLVAVALVAAVLGSALTALQPGRHAATGAGWAVLSAVSFATTFVLLGRSGGLSPVGAVLVLRVTALGVLAVWLAARRGSVRLPRPAWPAALAIGTLDVTAFSLFVAAAAIGPIAIASVTGAQFATFSAIIGTVVLRERLAAWQYVGIVLTLAAVSALALAGGV